MNPFSPLYYLKQNMARTVSLLFVMSMAALCYFMGVYTSNIYDENMINIEFFKDFTVITPSEEKESRTQFEQLLDDAVIRESKGYTVMNVDYYTDATIIGNLLKDGYIRILFHTVMDIRGGVPFPLFHNAEDFQRFTDVLGLPYSGGDKAIIMSEKLARQFHWELGDTIGNDFDMAFGFKDNLTLTDTYKTSRYGVPGAYTSFRLDSDFTPVDESRPNAVLLLREDCDDVRDIPGNQRALSTDHSGDQAAVSGFDVY